MLYIEIRTCNRTYKKFSELPGRHLKNCWHLYNHKLSKSIQKGTQKTSAFIACGYPAHTHLHVCCDEFDHVVVESIEGFGAIQGYQPVATSLLPLSDSSEQYLLLYECTQKLNHQVDKQRPKQAIYLQEHILIRYGGSYFRLIWPSYQWHAEASRV